LRKIGSIPLFIKWTELQEGIIIDETINAKKIIDNVLFPDEIENLPIGDMPSIDWSIDLFRYSEEKLIIQHSENDRPFMYI